MGGSTLGFTLITRGGIGGAIGILPPFGAETTVGIGIFEIEVTVGTVVTDGTFGTEVIVVTDGTVGTDGTVCTDGTVGTVVVV